MALCREADVQRTNGDIRRGGCLNLEAAALETQISSRGSGFCC